jgi:transposase
VEYASEGRPPYSSSVLLKVWLFAYLNKIRSSRALERACHENVALLWLSGLLYPDHNTLWRFWTTNQKAIGELFRHTVRVACRMGLVDMVLNAVDGTKIQAVCSGRSGWSKETVEELLAALEPEIEQMEQQIQQTGTPEGSTYQLPSELADKKRLREQLQLVRSQMKQIDRGQLHPQEPEARRMPCEGRNRFGYNAQAVADSKAGVVVAAELTNQEQDGGLAVAMLEQAQANTGQKAQRTVADSGYGGAQDLAQAQAAGHELIAPPAQGSKRAAHPYHASHFEYDELKDVCVCPQGKELKLERITDKADRGLVRVYRCEVANCPVKNLCTKDRQGRMIELGQHHKLVTQQREKLARPDIQALWRRRQVIIEPVFATIKELLGFRRWTLRGLARARTQWLWLCSIVNLIKIMKAKAQTA